MRRVLLALLAVVTLGASTTALSALPAAGEAVEAYDASVDVVGVLEEISPAGNFGLYDVTVALEGLTQAELTVTTNVTGGAIDTAYSNLAACTATSTGNTGATNTCTVTVTPSTPATFRLAVKSDTEVSCTDSASGLADCVVVTSSLTPDDSIVVLDLNPENDSDSVTTAVNDPDNNSAAFVPVNGSLTFEANGQIHTLTVTDLADTNTGGGAIVSMTDPGAMTCGLTPCFGVRIEFQQGGDGEAYEATTEVDSSDNDICKGLGAPAGCVKDVYWRDVTGSKGEAHLVNTVMEDCSVADPSHPCFLGIQKVESVIHYLSRMETTDPDISLPV